MTLVRSSWPRATAGLLLALLATAGQTACMGAESTVDFPESDEESGEQPTTTEELSRVAGIFPKSVGPALPDPGTELPVWPNCQNAPTWSWSSSIHDIWLDDPKTPKPVWLHNVVVTGISQGGCESDELCQLFVQTAPSYKDLDEASRQSLRMLVTPGTSEHFAAVHVGDRIDTAAWAFRKTTGGDNELLLYVSADYPGCAVVVGTAEPEPVPVQLDELSADAYEQELGPVLVQLEDVTGTPTSATSTFAIWDDDGYDKDDCVTSISPYFATNSSFDGMSLGNTINIAKVTGVFGLFVPESGAKYEEIYIREPQDIVWVPGP